MAGCEAPSVCGCVWEHGDHPAVVRLLSALHPFATRRQLRISAALRK